MRVVVVGASSGLGRSIAIGLARNGARVALMARRRERLHDAAREAGAGSVTIACDVTDESSCRAAFDAAATELGGIDGLVYAAGVGPLRRIADTDAAIWQRTLATNVIGASLTTACAIDQLSESGGIAAYLSSVSASLTPPWPGLGAYITSKAALDKLVEVWRAEHPRVGFTRIAVGDCAPGEGGGASGFVDDWDKELAAEMFPLWMSRGYMSGALIDVAEVVRVVDTVLRSGASASLPSVTLTPRPRQSR